MVEIKLFIIPKLCWGTLDKH